VEQGPDQGPAQPRTPGPRRVKCPGIVLPRMAVRTVTVALPWRMAETEAAAELRITRVKALDDRNLIAVVTYMLAKYPETFPAMLDDALSTISPKADG
jgi:hypothetical protein